MWSPETENCQNRNQHISKIGKLLPVCPTNNRRRSDHISEPHAKFGENRWRIVDVILNRIQIRNLHISKIRFLFPVSFTIEYKVGIAEFYLFMGFAAKWSVEKCGHQSLKTAKIGIRSSLKSANYFRFISQTTGVITYQAWRRVRISDVTYSVFWGRWRRYRYDRFVDSCCVSRVDSRCRPADQGTDRGMDIDVHARASHWTLRSQHVN